MDKCTFCAGGPPGDNTPDEYGLYGTNRLAEGKLPLCAEMCSTRALMAGDGAVLEDIYRERSFRRGYGSGAGGWAAAYAAQQGDSFAPGPVGVGGRWAGGGGSRWPTTPPAPCVGRSAPPRAAARA